jgi:hypothetical protein
MNEAPSSSLVAILALANRIEEQTPWLQVRDAAADWRTCKRERCRASERLVEGQWVSNARLYKFHNPVIEGYRRRRRPRQTMMWDSRD